MRKNPRILLLGLALLCTASCAQQEPGYTPVATVEDLMEGMVAPAADVVFGAVYSEITEAGIKDIRPQNAEEWDEVRHNAMALVEAGNMLKFDREHGDKADWQQMCQSLMDSATLVANKAEAKDPEGILQAGGVMYDSCLGCHELYIPEEAVQ